MINDMKAELERILFLARRILEMQHTVNEESRSAVQIEHSVLKLLGQGDRKICPECGYLESYADEGAAVDPIAAADVRRT